MYSGHAFKTKTKNQIQEWDMTYTSMYDSRQHIVNKLNKYFNELLC